MFRIVFGLVCLAGVVRFFAHGWVSELYVEPAHHFTYLGFGWVTPWHGWGMYLHFALLETGKAWVRMAMIPLVPKRLRPA